MGCLQRFLCLCLLIAALPSCKKEEGKVPVLPFQASPVIKPLSPLLKEISGIADSEVNAGHLFAHEDGGNPAHLYLFNHEAQLVKTFYLDKVTNRDWEDMEAFNKELFIADIGDNNSNYNNYTIYRFPEPTLSNDTIKSIQQINFTYPDGPHDAEAMIIDPLQKDIIIITKRDTLSAFYRLPFPYTNTTLQKLGSLPYNGVTAAAISHDGTEILIKTYDKVRYYNRPPGKSITDALASSFTQLPYVIEPQGESISFKKDGKGYFTLSETGFATTVNLYYYPR